MLGTEARRSGWMGWWLPLSSPHILSLLFHFTHFHVLSHRLLLFFLPCTAGLWARVSLRREEIHVGRGGRCANKERQGQVARLICSPWSEGAQCVSAFTHTLLAPGA